MQENYTTEQIITARDSLATGNEALRERVAEAHRYLMRASNHTSFEPEFQVIEAALASVKHGDYSRVTRQELLARAVVEMFGRLRAREPAKGRDTTN